MKRIPLLAHFLFAVFSLPAQDIKDYDFGAGATASLSISQKLDLYIVSKTNDGTSAIHDNLAGLTWTINGHAPGTAGDADGYLEFKQPGKDNPGYGCYYVAPSRLPAKNPVIVEVKFRPAADSKATFILRCSITITDAYKLSGEITISTPITGTDMKLQLDGYARYTLLDNGNAMLELLNGGIKVKVVKGIMVNRNGATGRYTGPAEYTVPALISIEGQQNNKSLPATFYVNSFSSPNNNETYLMQSSGASTTVQQNFITSKIRNAFLADVTYAARENETHGMETLEWAERMKSIKNKKPDQLTEQDKKDLAQLKSLQQKTGTNKYSNPVSAGSGTGKNAQLTPTQVTELNKMTPAMAEGNGAAEMNFSCNFNPGGKTVLEITKTGNEIGGQTTVAIHIKIEKP